MTSAIILCAGSSIRMNGVNKQFIPLDGIPVAIRSALNFERCSEISEIIIAAREQDIPEIRRLCGEYGISKLKAVVPGGSTRAASARAAFGEVGDAEFVAVHDGARPFATPELISSVIGKAAETGAAIAAIPVRDTLKRVENDAVAETPDRSLYFAAQTPQVFRKELYSRMCGLNDASATDDAYLAERLGVRVLLAEGSDSNIKITTPADIHEGSDKMPRIGHGYDVHRLVPDRKLILGGVEVPFDLGLLGHSDADVLIHAVMDALLGALSLGDIGLHFPDSDPRYKGANSMELLKRVVKLVHGRGYALSNLDAVIIAEKPKLAPFIPQMRENIAAVCGVAADRVSVKATTEEGLGLKGEGIGANCVCLLEKR